MNATTTNPRPQTMSTIEASRTTTLMIHTVNISTAIAIAEPASTSSADVMAGP